MTLQLTAIFTGTDHASDQSITHYQLLNWDSFATATLSKPQVVAMIEAGTKILVANADGVQIPCAVNTRSSVSGITEKWLQGRVDNEWTDDVLALPRLQDINGAVKVRRYTIKHTAEVTRDEQ